MQERIQELLKGRFKVEGIQHVNHSPHPFMIGPKHVEFCADNYYGIMGDACIEDKRFPKCSAKGCNLTYEEHTSDRVLFLKLVRNIDEQEAKALLLSITDLLKEDKVDGITFIETPEKFRVL